MPSQESPSAYLSITGVCAYGLKNINLQIPHYKLTVLTGVNGSGKSRLALLLRAEGARRYIGALPSQARYIDPPEHTNSQISGLQAVINIGDEQSSNRRATLGTITDIYPFLCLLYARIADPHHSDETTAAASHQEIQQWIEQNHTGACITFLAPLKARKGGHNMLFAQLLKQGFKYVIIGRKRRSLSALLSFDPYARQEMHLIVHKALHIAPDHKQALQQAIEAALTHGRGSFSIQSDDGKTHHFTQCLTDSATGFAYEKTTPSDFSFHSARGACPTCQGSGSTYVIDRKVLIPDATMSIAEGGIPILGAYKYNATFHKLADFLHHYQCTLRTPIQAIPAAALNALLYGRTREATAPINIAKIAIKRASLDRHAQSIQIGTCPTCRGQRLQEKMLRFTINKHNIAALCAMDLPTLAAWLHALPKQLTSHQNKIARGVLKEIQQRLQLLMDIGLFYLHLGVGLGSLSSGELRRIRIASRIGTRDTRLVGMLYIIDEPTIRLHPRDVIRVVTALKALIKAGNTVIALEHNHAIMRAADHLVAMGPGAGKQGGEVVAAAPTRAFIQGNSITAQFLKGTKTIPIPSTRAPGSGQTITISGCRGNNLKNITLTLPLGKINAITGVSGSGKTTLISATLAALVRQHLQRAGHAPLPHTDCSGLEQIHKLIEIPAASIRRAYRSKVVTYMQLFEPIRRLLAHMPEAKMRGYTVSRFSYNIAGGRCETCQGVGLKRVVMDFLPDLSLRCPLCKGSGYNEETLKIRYRGKSMSDLLAMTVGEARVFFQHHAKLLQPLRTLEAIGLAYITLGQSLATLSEGEGQRLKLARALTQKMDAHTLCILDEPTESLHVQDAQQLIELVQARAREGVTFVCTTHDLNVIKTADHVIDLGPEAGEAGGQIVAEGTPKQIAHHAASHTGRFLREVLNTP